MKHPYRVSILMFTLFCLGSFLQVKAQKAFRFVHRLDSLITKVNSTLDIDTNYVERPKNKWVIKGRFNVSGAKIGSTGIEEGKHFRSEMTADCKSTLSIAIGYRGLMASFALNPAKLLGHYSDYELNLQSYGKRFGFEFTYQDAHNFTGWYEIDEKERTDLPSDLLTLKAINLNTYFAFNHRRFSYPAAFSQRYIQRKSAGSFLLAASGQGQKGTVGNNRDFKFSMMNIGIGAGYGYNYVPARNWLLHLSALPTFIVYNHTSLTFNDSRVPLKYHFPEVIITGRSSIVREFGNKFIGITAVFNYTNIGDSNRLSVLNTKWRTRLFFGLRL